MAVITASLTDGDGVPLRRVFVEHIAVAGPIETSLGWKLTDANGSFTFDAGFGFDRIDVRVHCRNSVIRVVDDSDAIPGTSHIRVKMNFGQGENAAVGSFGPHFRILAQAQDVYDTVWRQFRPYNRTSRGAFPLGRRPSVLDTFAKSPTCEAAFPDKFPGAQLSFVEPVAAFNSLMPIAHIKKDPNLFGTATDDRSLIPHELGHVFHFAALREATRAQYEAGYLAHLAANLLPGGNLFHGFDQKTSPLVAFIEAVGIFSARFLFFAKQVEPNLTGSNLRRAFFRDELSSNRSLPDVLVDNCPRAGLLSGATVTPSVTTDAVEGAVYGAIYLDFARQVGLREAVGLVLDSNAADFGEFQTYVHGRGNAGWAAAIDDVAVTWQM
ncbi:MAG: hypothetical protein L0K86_25805 [Actinomycetia bacterium]|nr:hypothetical protein [Actinomycetes bacterium]